MGPEKGDSARGGASDAHPPGGPPPIEFELVDDDLPGEGTPEAAVAGAETIRGGGSARLARLGRTPVALRALGALAAAAALAVALWPGPGRHDAQPSAAPSATTTAAPDLPAIDVDLYKVRVTGTGLNQDDLDHAVMGLELGNGAADPLTVVNAEVWDAVGTRLGFSATWPAGEIDARGATTLPMVLPYSCSTLVTAPVLPITIRYSVSTMADTSISHNYEYPLDPTVLDEFMHARAGHCMGPNSGVFAASVDMVPQLGDHHDRHGFDLLFSVDAVGHPGWTIRSVTAAIPGVAVSSPDMPTAIPAGETGRFRVHFSYADCLEPPSWGTGFPAIQVTARPDGAPADGSRDETQPMLLRPELLTKMLQAACWQ